MRSPSADLIRTLTDLLLTYGWLIGLTLGALLGVQAVNRWIKQAWRGFKRRRRFARAARAEDAAAKLLARRGYRVLESQPELSWEVKLSGRPYTVDIRADYLVARGRRRYIAEVKTGSQAPSITTSATRRQLLEYLMAYPVDGVLLVDMEDESIYHVDFSGLHALGASHSGALLRGLIAGLLIGAALTAMVLRGP